MAPSRPPKQYDHIPSALSRMNLSQGATARKEILELRKETSVVAKRNQYTDAKLEDVKHDVRRDLKLQHCMSHTNFISL